MPDPFAGHVAPDPAAGPEIPPDQPPKEFAVTRPLEGPRPTMGRIVHYVLSENDINNLPWTPRGSEAQAGDAAPAIVARDYMGALSLTVFLHDASMCVVAREEGTDPGQWSWPPSSTYLAGSA